MKIRYCLLSKSIPEYSKRDDSLYTCSIGYSNELGLIRIYPLPPTGLKKWGVYELDVEKNKRDNRIESWKITSSSRKENWKDILDDILFIGNSNIEKISSLLMRNISPSISKLNAQRKSIGLIKADMFNIKWSENERFINTNQIGLFSDVEIANFTSYTKETKQAESRIVFTDEDGVHNLQFNEWSVYEYQRKFGVNNDAFRFIRPSNESYILIGNMNIYRSSWIALGVFNLSTKMSLQIF